jgi:hypothetical protein
MQPSHNHSHNFLYFFVLTFKLTLYRGIIERKIIFHGEYFTKFYLQQTAKVQEKIEYVLRIVRQVERVPKTFLQHMESTEGL